MKSVTAVLMVYVILVIASSIFWVWYALSKSSLAARSNTGNVKLATDPDKMKQDAELVNDKATELTGGFTGDARPPAESPYRGCDMRHKSLQNTYRDTFEGRVGTHFCCRGVVSVFARSSIVFRHQDHRSSRS